MAGVVPMLGRQAIIRYSLDILEGRIGTPEQEETQEGTAEAKQEEAQEGTAAVEQEVQGRTATTETDRILEWQQAQASGSQQLLTQKPLPTEKRLPTDKPLPPLPHGASSAKGTSKRALLKKYLGMDSNKKKGDGNDADKKKVKDGRDWGCGLERKKGRKGKDAGVGVDDKKKSKGTKVKVTASGVDNKNNTSESKGDGVGDKFDEPEEAPKPLLRADSAESLTALPKMPKSEASTIAETKPKKLVKAKKSVAELA